MRLGCVGCLLLLAAILMISVLGLGMVFFSGNIFGTPDIRPVSFTRADGYAAQQRLYELFLRESGRSSRRDPVVITEPEANAFLSRHLEQSGMPLSPIVVRFSRGQFTAQGQTQLRNLFKGPVLAQLVPYLPDKRLDERAWITVRGRISVDGTGKDRYGSVEVDEFVLGRQPLGGFLLSVLMGPTGGGLLKWPVPKVVDEIQVDDRRLVITTR